MTMIHRDSNSPEGSIAQRTIHAKFAVKSKKSLKANPLPVNIKTIGDLIRGARQISSNPQKGS